jgi:hypothetical protein|tara:strand:- start:106 stop:309 length:204 start_codon:yes stop_codon:yes gene_type:complete
MQTFQQYLDENGYTDEAQKNPGARRAKRLARMNAHLKKTMAKYRAASDAGIHPSKVNQRRNKLTIKK